jgi:hypothetical protein
VLGVLFSTGVAAGCRDVSLILRGMYQYFLTTKFEDKRAAHEALTTNISTPPSCVAGHLHKFISIRPSSLTDWKSGALGNMWVSLDVKIAVPHTIPVMMLACRCSSDGSGQRVFTDMQANILP